MAAEINEQIKMLKRGTYFSETFSRLTQHKTPDKGMGCACAVSPIEFQPSSDIWQLRLLDVFGLLADRHITKIQTKKLYSSSTLSALCDSQFSFLLPAQTVGCSAVWPFPEKKYYKKFLNFQQAVNTFNLQNR